MKKTYYPKGTCSRRIDIDIEDGIVKEVIFTGGCNGNLQGISKLVEGKSANEIIPLLSGISCGGRPTSCPDQLARALEAAITEE